MVSVRTSQCKPSDLFSHYLYDDPLVTLAVEFRVEDALPGTEVEPARSDGNDDLMMDQERFQMRIAVDFPGIVMAIIFAKRRELLQPLIDVFNQAGLVVI